MHARKKSPLARVGIALAALAAVIGALIYGGTAEAGPAAARGGCAAWAGAWIPASVISLPTRGGRVTAASQITETVSGTSVTYCRVDAALAPIHRATPYILMRVALPVKWNHRSMMFGGGGFNGTIPDIRANVPFGPSGGGTPLSRGYATYASDSGHQANPAWHPVSSLEGSFAVNDEALRNFSAGDALKKTHDAAQFLIKQHYGQGPAHTYFAGGSTGGREALVVAQRWPTAFNGVISAYPAWNNLAEALYLGHATRQLARPGAFPSPAKQTLLYNSVIKACDGQDGLADKVISDPKSCDFSPQTLRCPGGGDTGPTCLSDRQITAITAVSSSWSWPYKVASGEKSYPGLPFLSGADMRTPLLGFGTTAPSTPMPLTSGYGMQYWDQWTKYFLTRNPAQNSLAINPSQPGPWLARISQLSTIQDRNNADLRPFQQAGGKLLLLQGAADELVSERSTSDYYKRVSDTVGQDTAQQFLRYYVVPGANHANYGSPAFTAGWDSLTALEAWSEQDQKPKNPVVTDATNGRTRPLCEYPRWPKYLTGAPNSASSFECAT
ncbi:tannase/feruloyl esterase family alpha/beta hydrolase [Streptomyces sp. NPDC050255]|uniref:tannase/feruloyl esterase family alpha/beta hydrolase n=1 Tax=Streptomyces sp. NPDC050255 TaxID=3365606 RepID=UPI0037AD6C6C